MISESFEKNSLRGACSSSTTGAVTNPESNNWEGRRREGKREEGGAEEMRNCSPNVSIALETSYHELAEKFVVVLVY